MQRELARKLPAIVVRAEQLPVRGLVGIERKMAVREDPRRRGTPADWPWYVWTPLLLSIPPLAWGLVLIIVAML